MAQKIVGLDIGSYSIKAVVLESTYRGWELIGYHETKLATDYIAADPMLDVTPYEPPNEAIAPDSEDTDADAAIQEDQEEITAGEEEDEESSGVSAIAQAESELNPEHERLRLMIETFIKRHGADWDSLYTALDGDTVSIKLVSLPFSDPKKVETTLPHVLDDMLPFSTEDKLLDYQLLTKGETNTLLAAILDRKQMAQYLAYFNKSGKEPKKIILDSLALGNLFEQLAPVEQREGVEAIVDLGHRTTSVCIVKDGSLAYIRTIPYGSQDVTQAIADDLDIDFSDAERKKHLEGFVSSSTFQPEGAEQRAICDTIESALVPLIQQLKITFQAFVAEHKAHVRHVQLVGGGSRLNNIGAHLSEKLEGVPVEPFKYLRSDFDRMAESGEVEMEMAAGLGMAFAGLGGSRMKQINLRKGPFAFKGDFEYWKTRIASIALNAAFIFMFFIINIWSQFYVLSGEEESMAEAIGNSCQKILGRNVTDAKICMSEMMAVINEQGSGGTQLKPSVSTLVLFDELVSRITKEGIEATLEELEIQEKKIKVKGQVDSIPTVGAIVENLKDYNCFHNINQGPTRQSVKGDKIEFSLSILVDCDRKGSK